MKKIVVVLLIIFLTGCTDYKDINDLAIVSAIGIEKQDNKFMVTVQIINPQKADEKSSEESSILIYQGKGNTLYLALSDISEQSPKYLFLSHLKSIVIDNEIMTNEQNKILDFLSRYPESSLNYNVLITDDVKPHEVLSILTPLEDNPSLYTNDVIENNKKFISSISDITFLEYISNYLEYGINSVFPLVTIITNNDESSSAYMKNYLQFENLVTYNSNGEKLILDLNNSIGFNILTNGVENALIPMKCRDSDEMYVISITKSNSKFKNNEAGTVNINVNIEGEINEYNCKQDLNYESTLKNIEVDFINEINNYLYRVINYAKENKNDFIGIGKSIYKSNPNYFDFEKYNWDQEGIDKLNIKIETKTEVFVLGDLRKSINQKEIYEKD